MYRIRAASLEFDLTAQKIKSKMFEIESQDWKDSQHWADSKEAVGLDVQCYWRKIILMIDSVVIIENSYIFVGLITKKRMV